jgi:hypothetical protein
MRQIFARREDVVGRFRVDPTKEFARHTATLNGQRFVAVISRCHRLPRHNPSEAVVD